MKSEKTLFLHLQLTHKIVILSEAPHRFIAWYSAGRGVEGPRGSLSCQCCSELFDYPSPRTQFFLRYALDGHGYISSCTVIIFHPQVCAESLNRGRSARCGLRWLKGCQRHEQNKRPSRFLRLRSGQALRLRAQRC